MSEANAGSLPGPNLEIIANKMRQDIIKMLAASGSGHPGGSLSCVDILAALFFSGNMVYDHNDMTSRADDRFLLSKGHAAPALYAAYHSLGWISDNELLTLRKLGSRLQGHPDAKFLYAVEVCSGSLGQGLSIGCGLALGMKLDARRAGVRPNRVYVLCGDGELQEGSNWEAMMFAAHQHLDNLTMLVDFNRLQIDGSTDEVCSLGNLEEKLLAFGWLVRVINGHNVDEIVSSLSWSRKMGLMPQAIICNTVKGKGVSYMENEVSWHGKAMNSIQAMEAKSELVRERAGLFEMET